MTVIELCKKDSCWCVPQTTHDKTAVFLSAKTVDSILNATMTPAIFWEVVQACRDTVTPHPRRTNLNESDALTTISIPVSVHP